MEEEEDSAISEDSSGNDHDGTVGADASFTQHGYMGRAADFDAGCSSAITVDDHSDLEMGTSAFTIEAWIKPDTDTKPATIISKWDENGGNKSYMLRIDSDGKLEGKVYSDADGGSLLDCRR